MSDTQNKRYAKIGGPLKKGLNADGKFDPRRQRRQARVLLAYFADDGSGVPPHDAIRKLVKRSRYTTHKSHARAVRREYRRFAPLSKLY